MNNFRIISRKFRYFIRKIINNLKFKIESFNFPKIVILSAVILGVISLFLIHLKSNNPLLQANIFNKITTFSAYIAILAYSITLFLLFSFYKKETIKKSSLLLFRDYSIILFLAILLTLLSINNIFTINALKMFSSEIYLGNGAILFLFSSIMIIIGAILLKNDYNNKNIIINDSTKYMDDNDNKETNNTKLPF